VLSRCELERASDGTTTPTTIGTARASAGAASRPRQRDAQQKATIPNTIQTRSNPRPRERSADEVRLGCPTTDCGSATAWTNDGSIIAIIITIHMPREQHRSAGPCLSRHTHPRHRHPPAAGHRHLAHRRMDAHRRSLRRAGSEEQRRGAKERLLRSSLGSMGRESPVVIASRSVRVRRCTVLDTTCWLVIVS